MIYLIRHGLDDESKIGGWSDVSLTNEGIKQVEKAKKYIIDNLSFEKIISSDVKRAKETSQIINKNLNKKITYTKKLREQSKGKYNGVKKSDLDKNDYFLGNIKIYDKYPEGESLLNLYERIKGAMEYIMSFEDDTLIVTHRGVINMLYYILTNTPLDMDKKQFGVTHATLHELDKKKLSIRKVI